MSIAIMWFIRNVAPDRWEGLDPKIHLDLGNYLRHIFLESETAAAVLTCTPGGDDHSILTNPEVAATREQIDRLAGTGRLINHSIVHPNAPGELDRLGSLMEHNRPSGWKVYTIAGWGDQPGWRLDDEESGLPFLESSRELGVDIICAHKGLSALAPAGSRPMTSHGSRPPSMNTWLYNKFQ